MRQGVEMKNLKKLIKAVQRERAQLADLQSEYREKIRTVNQTIAQLEQISFEQRERIGSAFSIVSRHVDELRTLQDLTSKAEKREVIQ